MARTRQKKITMLATPKAGRFEASVLASVKRHGGKLFVGRGAKRHVAAISPEQLSRLVDGLGTHYRNIRESEDGENLVTAFLYAAAKETTRTGDLQFIICALAAAKAWRFKLWQPSAAEMAGLETAPASPDAISF